MRAFLILIASTFLLSSPAVAAVSGAYNEAAAVNADACAHRCANDSLCMMWVYRTDNVCELRAGVSSNFEALAAGVSPHAPEFARTMTIVVVTPALTPPPATPQAPPARRHRGALLAGGPTDDHSGLRPRLGDTP
jgi:hypothetical protein